MMWSVLVLGAAVECRAPEGWQDYANADDCHRCSGLTQKVPGGVLRLFMNQTAPCHYCAAETDAGLHFGPRCSSSRDSPCGGLMFANNWARSSLWQAPARCDQLPRAAPARAPPAAADCL